MTEERSPLNEPSGRGGQAASGDAGSAHSSAPHQAVPPSRPSQRVTAWADVPAARPTPSAAEIEAALRAADVRANAMASGGWPKAGGGEGAVARTKTNARALGVAVVVALLVGVALAAMAWPRD